MNTTPAFRGLHCRDCGVTVDTTSGVYRCPECAGVLESVYDMDEAPDATTIEDRDSVGPFRYAEFLPFPSDAAVTIDEGATPAVSCPRLADELGVRTLRIKDEGRNPTGALVDRGLSVAVTAAVQRNISGVVLPSTGTGGQSVAAYAGRRDIESRSFVPTRCPFVNKAMVNVHGGTMNVVEGRYEDAFAAYEGWLEEHDGDAGDEQSGEPTEEWALVGPASPYRRDGVKTLYFELVESNAWTAPDAVVVPTGHGITLAGIHAAIQEFDAAGLADDQPRLYAAQPAGCAPVVEAWQNEKPVESVDRPDTIVGPLEIADPAVGTLAVDALTATDGGAVAVDDDAALENAAMAASETGVEVGASGGVAVAGARELADRGVFEHSETVVLINPIAGSKEADLLRSYLMSQGM